MALTASTVFLVTIKALTLFDRKNSGVNGFFCWYKGVHGV